MRLLVVIAHYFGPRDPHSNHAVLGSYLEPLGRIAALNEAIVCLHRNFGPHRNALNGAAIATLDAGNTIDIVIVTMRERNVLSDLGIAEGIYAVHHVDGAPSRIPFHARGLMKERAGDYDFYCFMEDDLAIHDPDFFAKLIWFQAQFGPRALLAPTRVETAFTGTPAKIVIDPELGPRDTAPFRRPGQHTQISAPWHGATRGFALPSNPHAGAFFLTRAQLALWIADPSFDDGDASWIGPLESAATLGIGKVFDIYKATTPDPFFLEIHHYGTAYAARHPPHGRRYGEPPLLAIAQNALRAAMDGPGGERADTIAGLMATQRGTATLVEHVARITAAAAADLRVEQRSQLRSLRWLAGSMLAELRRRLRASRQG